MSDTGAFVALVDRDEKLHDDCIAELEKWTGHVVTTEAVLTETLYLVGPDWRAQKICLECYLSEAHFNWFLHRRKVYTGSLL